jgi:hypothetical protein
MAQQHRTSSTGSSDAVHAKRIAQTMPSLRFHPTGAAGATDEMRSCHAPSAAKRDVTARNSAVELQFNMSLSVCRN